MSLPKPDLHLHLCPEAMDALAMLADMDGRAKSNVAERLLEECLLGRIHSARVAAARALASGFAGRFPESRGK